MSSEVRLFELHGKLDIGSRAVSDGGK